MKRLLNGSVMLLAAVALLATGCDSQVRVQKEWSPEENDPSSYRDAVAEVVVTAERPAGLMPEVMVIASAMPEVVVHATWCPMPVAVTTIAAGVIN